MIRKNYPGDLLIMLLIACAYAALECWIAPRGTMTEGDSYRMLFGILNSRVSGFGLLDVMHYGTSFSFGYLAFIYGFAGESALHHPAELIDFMNHIGYVSAVATVFLFWLCAKQAYGSKVATSAMLLFALSPAFIQLGTEGHPILPAYMFLMAGAASIFKEGRWYHTTAGLLLLLIGMTMRADILFVFPWLALTHSSAASWKDYARRVLGRLVFLLPLFLCFLLARHTVLGSPQAMAGAATSTGQSFASYMHEFFVTGNIIGGGMTAAFACGIATVVAFAFLALLLLRRARLTPENCALFAGPVVMIILALGFWIPIGINARHFITFTLGASLFIPLVLACVMDVKPMHMLGIALLLVMANQLVAEGIRPIVLAHYHSSYLGIPDAERTLTMAPIGFTWKHMLTLEERHRIYQRWIDGTMKDVCDSRTIVLMDYDDAEQAMSSLFAGDPAPESHLLEKGDFKRIVSLTKGKRTFVFVSKADVWPSDPLALILARPDLSDAAILPDPYSLSIYDHAEVPANRMPHFGCKSAR